MIVGIVLAAGRSRRMGRPKAFLETGGETFLARAISALRLGGCREVIAVVGPAEVPDHEAIAHASRAAGAHVVVNAAPDSEQLDSLRAALHELPPSCTAVVVTPVDVPNPRAATVEALVSRFLDSGAALAVPTHAGARGHPLLIARPLFGELISGDLPEGMRSLQHAHEHDLVEVRVADPGVLLDVDTPNDYRNLMERDE